MCQLPQCMGTLVHVEWSDGHESWFCSSRLDYDPSDRSWQINEGSS